MRPDPVARLRGHLSREIARLVSDWITCGDPEEREEIELELEGVEDALASLNMCFA
ncbi:hypothetical protein ACLBYG_22185 [Methylobacterium sp. D53M]